MTLSVGIFVFNNVEVLDFSGPYEVFTCASRISAIKKNQLEAVFDVFTIAESKTLLHARAGLNVLPDHDFVNHPAIDILIIPGGVVTEELAKIKVIEWIAREAAQSTLTASICTGAFLLAQAGLLNNKAATTHWEDCDDLKTMFPFVQVQLKQRWVDTGQIVTSGGISAGIDMSLHIVERFAGRHLAELTAHQMEFYWAENA